MFRFPLEFIVSPAQPRSIRGTYRREAPALGLASGPDGGAAGNPLSWGGGADGERPRLLSCLPRQGHRAPTTADRGALVPSALGGRCSQPAPRLALLRACPWLCRKGLFSSWPGPAPTVSYFPFTSFCFLSSVSLFFLSH